MADADPSHHNFFSVANRRYDVVISDRPPRFIWYRVAKAASTTMVKVLKRHGLPHQVVYGTSFDSRHVDDSYFKFGFVRNPWARLVSCYENKVRTKHPQQADAFGSCWDRDFNYFVEFVNEQDLAGRACDHHIALQTVLIPFDQVKVDFVGRLETFDSDISQLFQRLGVRGSGEYPKLNASLPADLPYTRYYSPRTSAVVAEKYREDIRVLGYDDPFHNPSPRPRAGA